MGTNRSVSILRRVEIIENKEREFNQMKHFIVSRNNLDLLEKEQIRIRRMLKDLDDRIVELENIETTRPEKQKGQK